MLLSFALVSFALASPGASKVQFASDLKGWSSPEWMVPSNGRWTIAEDIPEDARIEYKFILDGNWILDPANPRKIDNGVGGENSVWEGRAYRKTTLDKTPAHPMKASSLSIEDEGVKHAVRVFMPATGGTQLPILIYGDGKGYEDRLHAAVILENLIEARKVGPAILVLVEPNDRMAEYWKSPKSYEAFVAGPLLDTIRSKFPASTSPREVYIGG